MVEGRFLVYAKNAPQLYRVSLNEKYKTWFVPKEVEENFQKPTHELNLDGLWVRKWLAVKSHKSQRYAQIKITMPLWFYLSKYHYEWYHKVDFNKKYKAKYIEFSI